MSKLEKQLGMGRVTYSSATGSADTIKKLTDDLTAATDELKQRKDYLAELNRQYSEKRAQNDTANMAILDGRISAQEVEVTASEKKYNNAKTALENALKQAEATAEALKTPEQKIAEQKAKNEIALSIQKAQTQSNTWKWVGIAVAAAVGLTGIGLLIHYIRK